ncbi:universal stress family protein [Bordetella bronchiseptica GA96-01]|nr:universal stress family protein [Bordetella bronchiseptica CA90 BB02]KCV32578.1 universal stress family protein [Bordetella bronchiseptica 00-P-2730]KCV42851.1 universal stress family protein [Bordetella bronchiseptica 345]KDC23960.1 universal stress family protein [Bordetella bronchiseptica F4563]KDC37276.1 universal stress family protein [Bordetella bronchiseptica GA96-01]KDE00834.1 universal stress family protein [Bordetella bronchiseptica SBL-F6116]
MVMKNVIACISSPRRVQSICDYAIWAVRRLGSELELLHVVEREQDAVPIADLSGGIWMGAQETLLKELAELDERRQQLAQEQGRQLLQAATERAREAGIQGLAGLARQGYLVDVLLELEDDARLFVMGQHDRPTKPSRLLPDQHLEASVRALHRPVLVAGPSFVTPTRFLVAFDGSATSRKTVEMVSRSPLLQGMQAHVLTAGSDAGEARQALQWAREQLAQGGFDAITHHAAERPADALATYAGQHGIDMLVMGAYGHSRIRQLVLGSTTTEILSRVSLAVLILR